MTPRSSPPAPYVDEIGVKFRTEEWRMTWEQVFRDHVKGKHTVDAWMQKNSRMKMNSR